METPEQRHTRGARHEAAHVIAAVIFSHRFQFVAIVPKDEKRGNVSFPEEWSQNPTPEHAREMAIIYLAARTDAELHKLLTLPTAQAGGFFLQPSDLTTINRLIALVHERANPSVV